MKARNGSSTSFERLGWVRTRKSISKRYVFLSLLPSFLGSTERAIIPQSNFLFPFPSLTYSRTSSRSTDLHNRSIKLSSKRHEGWRSVLRLSGLLWLVLRITRLLVVLVRRWRLDRSSLLLWRVQDDIGVRGMFC